MAQNFLSDIKLGDNIYIRLGDSTNPDGDLQIYHDGNQSFITDAGTGNLRIQGTNLALQNAAGTKNYFLGTDGGNAIIYHNNSEELKTNVEGIEVVNNLGVGRYPSPIYGIYQEFNSTDANTDNKFAYFIDGNFSGADNTDGDREQGGIRIDIDSTADGDASNEHRLYGVWSDVRFSGYSDLVRAGWFYAENNIVTGSEKQQETVGLYASAVGDGTNTDAGTNNLKGVHGQASVQNVGYVGAAFGGFFQSYLAGVRTADANHLVGVRGEVEIDSSSSITLGNARAVQAIIDVDNTTPTVTNSFLYHGTYEGDTSNITNRYGLFIQNSALNKIDGTLGIAGSTPVSTSALTIKSQSVSSQQSAIDIIQNGSGTNSIIRMGEKSTDGGRLHMFESGTEMIAFYTDGTANHISAGNLGLGTNNATYKLQVQGTFYVNETAYINGVTTIDASLNQTGGDASTFSGNLSAKKLTSTDGILELDDNGTHNGIINVPASLRINIDSDNNNTGESFQVANNATNIDDNNILFKIEESGAATFAGDVTIDKADPTLTLESNRTTIAAGNTEILGQIDFKTNEGSFLNGPAVSARIKVVESEYAATTMSFWTSTNPDDTLVKQLEISPSGLATFTGNINAGSNTVTAATFSGDLNGTINTATTATTQSASDNSTKVATTAYVTTAVSNLIGGAPGALDTLDELAEALNDDDDAVVTLTNNLATKAPLSLPQFTNRVGIGVAPHATAALNITNTSQHIRLNNGSELGVFELDTNGVFTMWAHGDGETINFKTGSGSGVVAAHIDGTDTTFEGNVIVNKTSGGLLQLRRDDSSIAINNRIGTIEFQGDDPTDGTFNTGALIFANAAGTWDTNDYPTKLFFQTDNAGTLTTALTLDDSQNATFAGDVKLSTAGKKIIADFSSGGTTRKTELELYNSSNGGFILNNEHASTGGIKFQIDGNDALSIAKSGRHATFGGSVGVGVAGGSNAKLEVVSASGEVFRADAASGAFRIVANQTGVSTQGTFSHTGKVGINVTSLSSMFTLQGNETGDQTITHLHLNSGNNNSFPFLASLNNATISSATYGWTFNNSSSNGNLEIGRRNNSTTTSTVLTLERSTGNATFAGDVTIPEYIYHTDDPDTKFGFSGVDAWKVNTGGSTAILAHDNGSTYLYHSGSQKFNTTSSGVAVTGNTIITDTANPDGGSGAGEGGSLIVEGRRDGTANLISLRARDASAPTAALPNGQGGLIRWQGFDGTDFAQMGAIAVVADGQAVANGDSPSKMIFYTTADGGEALTTALTLDKSQNATFEGDVIATGNTRFIKITNGHGNTGIQLASDSTGDGQLRVNDYTGATKIFFYGEANNDSYINNGGDFGIGTDSPEQDLHVKRADNASVLFLERTGNNAGYVLLNGSINPQVAFPSDQDLRFVTVTNSSFDNLSEKMRITSGGKVGIGISTPNGTGTNLQVQSDSHSQIAAHFGQGQSNTNTHYGGISLGYAEAANALYRKVAIVAEARGDGAARQNLHFLVDTANDQNSAVLADSKFNIDGLTGDATFASDVNIAATKKIIFGGTAASGDDSASISFNNSTGILNVTASGADSHKVQICGDTIEAEEGGTATFANGAIVQSALSVDSIQNIGSGTTISFAGAITTNANNTFKSAAGSGSAIELNLIGTNTSGFGSSHAVRSRIKTMTDDSSNAYASKLEFYTNDASNNLDLALKLDSSQNATFGGGISMADSILIDYTGSDGQNNDAGLKIMNDGSDWGAYIRKDSNANYGLRIDSGGANAISVYSTTGGSTKTFNINGGTGDATFAGNVGINETSIDAKLHISDSTTPNIKFERPGTKKWAMGISGTDFIIDDVNDDLSTHVLKLAADNTATFAGNIITSNGLIQGTRTGANMPTSSNANLYLIDSRSMTNDVGGSIVFSGIYNNSGDIISGGPFIKGYKENNTAGDYGFGLKFGVRANGSGAITDPCLTLNSSGNATFAGPIDVNATSFDAGNNNGNGIDEFLAEFKGGTNNVFKQRYVKLTQTFTGSAKPSPLIVFEANHDGDNHKSYVTLGSTSDGEFYIRQGEDKTAVAAGSDLAAQTSETFRITPAGNVTISGSVDAASFTDIITNQIFTASGSLDIDTVLTGRDVTFTQGSNNLMAIKGDGSGVGIGTDAPGAKLHLSGAGQTELRIASTTANTNSLLSFYEGSLGAWGIDAGQANGKFFIKHLYNSTLTRLTIDNAGRVGIGNDSPTNTLVLARSSSGQGEHGLRLEFTDTDGPTNTSSSVLVGSYGLKFKNHNSSRNFLFETGNILMGNTVVNPASGFSDQRGFGYNDSNGNVQIGATDDIALTLGRNKSSDGTILSLRKQSSVIGTIGSNSSGGNPVLDIASSSSTSLMRFLTSGSERMRIDSSGKVGIGTDDPGGKLHVKDTSTQLILETPNTTNDIDFRWRENGTNKWNLRYQNSTSALEFLNQTSGSTVFQLSFLADGSSSFGGSVHLDSDSAQLQLGDDNDMQIFHNGANGEINIATGDFTIDSAGDITLDAAGNDIRLFKAGVEYGKFKNESGNLVLFSSIENEDIVFKGNDGGSTVTALTLDMSAGGDATFAGSLTVNGDIINTNSTSIFSNGAYLEIGTGASNTAQITFNADYDGGSTATYTPHYSGAASAGMSIIKMPSGGVGGIEFYVKKHGTTGGSHALSTFTKILNLHQDGDSTFAGHVNITGSSKNLVLANSNNIRFKNNAGAERNILTLDTNDDVQFGGSIDNIRFLTNDSSEKMRLDSSGRLGIGSTTPSHKLQVYDAVSDAPLKIESGDGFVGIKFKDPDANDNLYYRGDTESFYFTGNRLGINTSSPQEDLHIYGDTPVIRLTDSDTSRDAQIVAIDGNLRFDADNNDDQSSTNISFRTDGTTALTIDSSQDSTFAGNVELGDSSNISMSGASAGQLKVQGSGYTGAIALNASAMHIYHNSSIRDLILGTNETARLTIAGSSGNTSITGTFTAAGDVVAFSDERLKSNIETLDGSKVYEMRGVSFTKDNKEGSGVIAQELEKIAPELVNNDGEYKSVAYGNITGYLIEAIKDLKAEVEELKNELKNK